MWVVAKKTTVVQPGKPAGMFLDLLSIWGPVDGENGFGKKGERPQGASETLTGDWTSLLSQ